MGFSAIFIRRPVATILLSLGMLLAGAVAYRFLPVASLPSVDIPTIVVFAARPGADPETMANSIAAPLERRLGEISGVTEITSTSSIGNTSSSCSSTSAATSTAPHTMCRRRSTPPSPTCRPTCRPAPSSASSIRPRRRS